MGDSGSQLKTFVQWRLVEIENIKCAPAGDKIVTLFFYQITSFHHCLWLSTVKYYLLLIELKTLSLAYPTI